jgi:hypothetical protein
MHEERVNNKIKKELQTPMFTINSVLSYLDENTL